MYKVLVIKLLVAILEELVFIGTEGRAERAARRLLLIDKANEYTDQEEEKITGEKDVENNEM